MTTFNLDLDLAGLAAAGKTLEALSLFALDSDDNVEKINLIRSIANRKESGSIAWLNCENNDVEEGDSIAVLTDGRTGWMISRKKSEEKKGCWAAEYPSTLEIPAPKLDDTILRGRGKGNGVHFGLGGISEILGRAERLKGLDSI